MSRWTHNASRKHLGKAANGIGSPLWFVDETQLVFENFPGVERGLSLLALAGVTPHTRRDWSAAFMPLQPSPTHESWIYLEFLD